MTIFQKALIEQHQWSTAMAQNGYTAMTTFYGDFTIADGLGLDDIKDTYRNAFRSWKNDVRYLTELCMVLNHKIAQHYDNGKILTAQVYDALWRECDEWCCENLHGDDLKYYIETTD